MADEQLQDVINNQTTDSKTAVDDELAQVKAQVEEYLAGWQRAKADYANLEKSWLARQQQFLDMAKGAMVLELLPILDHFRLATSHIPPPQEKASWVQGIIHIQREMEQFLEKLGAAPIPPQEQFDPVVHEVIAHEPSNQPRGTVLRQARAGYTMNGQVIQPAQVVVSAGLKNPLAANPPPNEENRHPKERGRLEPVERRPNDEGST